MTRAPHERLLVALDMPDTGRAGEFSSTIESGYLELSNVDIAEQFSQIIEAQRAFQASSRVLATLNQVIQESTKLGL